MGAASELAFPAPDWLLRHFGRPAWPADATSRKAPKVAAAGSKGSKNCFLQIQMFGGTRNVVGAVTQFNVSDAVTSRTIPFEGSDTN
jgi:hypothetical protein